MGDQERLRILSRCVEKIGKAYDEKVRNDGDGKWSWSQFWKSMESKAATLVRKYLEREKDRQQAKRNARDNNNNNGKTIIGQNNTAS